MLKIVFNFLQKLQNRTSWQMTLSQSKLMIQLNKQQRISNRLSFNEQQIDELYNTICKLQPKNLMLVEFLTLIIQRDFIKNSNKLVYFVDLYEEIKGKNFDADHTYSKNNLEAQEQKFSKKKFTKMLKELSKKLYPGNPNAYQTILFERLTRIDTEQHRIKMDESIRKMLNKETISTINEYDQELQTIFEVYMPENYNLNLEFSWEEIKVLEKRLPIICCLRFLYETEVVPHFLSAVQFMEIVNKLKPPMMPSSNSSKEAMFYTSQTMATYLRDHINLPQIKLLEGDVGFTFFEFQIFFIKVATEFSKDSKHQYVSNIKKIAAYTKLKEAFDESTPRRNKFMELVKSFMKNKTGKNEKVLVKKRESRKKIQDLYDSKETESKEEEASKSAYKTIVVEPREIQHIMKDLDGELPDLPQKKKIQKENQGYYDVEKKHIVIGQQLPKIQEKAKTATAKQNKKKNEDSMLGYKSEVLRVVQNSDPIKMIARPKKMRVNTEFPIILNEIFYPSDLKNQLFISPKAEVYLQTSYIHLGQRLYQQAFLSYIKAKSLNDSKSSVTEFYYDIHAAQIFESAGRDELALSFYHKAKDLLAMLTSIEGPARAHPYIGMGACLYHLDLYQLAFRCFEKAKTLLGFGLQNESIENAILQNNIGCCLMMLNRNQEALKYFQVSHSTFDNKVGVFDERTLVVQQNFNKNRKAYLELMPEFKTMWKTYIQKSTTKLPTVKQNKPKK